MATTADFKNGMCLEFNNDIYKITYFQHVKPGKGPAFVRTKLKSLTTGKVIDNTFTSGVKINAVRVERRPYQFLFKEDTNYVFMHNETFEQIYIGEEIIDAPDLLKENQYVEIMIHAENETPLSCELPQFIDLEVTYTEPAIKGDPGSSVTLKPATVETGASIQVPVFIQTGDRIKIDTQTREYIERAK